jgi:uridylate kinase
MVAVLSVGGSVVAPDVPDVGFLSAFDAAVRGWLGEDPSRKLVLTVGGGGPARAYQKAYRALAENAAGGEARCSISARRVRQSRTESAADDEADWVGIMATRLNAQLVRAVFADLCCQGVVYDPTEVREFVGRVLVAAGWKPGFSTDTDAVLFAERFAAKTVINVSNIEKVYTADPRADPDAQPLDSICWVDFRKLVGDEWTPGKNVPFDPVASRRAEAAGIAVLCVGAKNVGNIRDALDGKPFVGTRIF